MTATPSTRYFGMLHGLLANAEATRGDGTVVSFDEAVEWAVRGARTAHQAGNKLMFIGNGGSAGICSHMATDYSKNGGLRSTAFNDSSFLTCLGNDLGYDQVFAKQIELHARPGDLLIAISSSGRSANILNGVAAARNADCSVLTLSGFTPDNPLRRLGDLNLYIDSMEYGFVEVGHLAMCHCILDFSMGWGQDTSKAAE